MIIHDFECQDCGNIHEVYMDHDFNTMPCQDCGGTAKKILSPRHTAPVDSDWISSVREVVDKKSNKPWCKEFLRHPTRANYKNWMAGEGLRHLEPGEPTFKKPDPARDERIKKKMINKLSEMEAISI